MNQLASSEVDTIKEEATTSREPRPEMVKRDLLAQEVRVRETTHLEIELKEKTANQDLTKPTTTPTAIQDSTTTTEPHVSQDARVNTKVTEDTAVEITAVSSEATVVTAVETTEVSTEATVISEVEPEAVVAMRVVTRTPLQDAVETEVEEATNLKTTTSSEGQLFASEATC